jgi:hypothetical protein
MAIEKQVIGGDSIRAYLGLVFGLVVSSSLIYVSYVLVNKGHEISGALLGAFDLGILSTTFMYGIHSRRAELKTKERK